MDRPALLCSLALLAVVLAAVVADEKYTDAFDDFDVDAMLQNDELRNQYLSCIMDSGPCDNDAQKFIKGIIYTILIYCTIYIYFIIFYNMHF